MSNQDALDLIISRNDGRKRGALVVFPTASAKRSAWREWRAWILYGII